MQLRSTLFWFSIMATVLIPAQAQMNLEVAFPALTFNLAIDIQHAGDGSNRLFVAEQPGLIKVLPNDASTTEATIFLDIRDRILANDRFGLLGLTFHPDYKNTGYFYIHYNAAAPDRSIISRFSVSTSDPDLADPSSELVILEVEQPHKFHNGGQLAFGSDGSLYIGFGDGGPFDGSPDPLSHGQNRSTLLGAFVRIDVDIPSADRNYSIPPDNPFVGNIEGLREEIWAWGFRNPWRFSFDDVTGWLWTGDNGENFYEEIDIVEKGKNYGWKTMEAAHCYSPDVGCTTDGLTLPVREYGGSTSQRRSVIGGYVYRGRKNPELVGKYIYADFMTGQGWALTYDGIQNPSNAQLFAGQPGIATFGVDEQGELYMSNIHDGKIYRFVPTSTSVESVTDGSREFHLEQNYPNPFSPTTSIKYTLYQTQSVNLSIYDIRGRLVRTLVNELETAGSRSVEWDGTDHTGNALPSGVYFYCLKNSSQRQTHALTLFR